MEDSKSIWIIAESDRSVRGGSTEWHEVPVDTLRAGVDGLLAGLQPMLDGMYSTLKQYRCEEIELSLAISASGKIGLFGTGSEIEGSGSVKVKLVRVNT